MCAQPGSGELSPPSLEQKPAARAPGEQKEASARALPAPERQAVLETLHDDDRVSKTPAAVYTKLLELVELVGLGAVRCGSECRCGLSAGRQVDPRELEHELITHLYAKMA